MARTTTTSKRQKTATEDNLANAQEHVEKAALEVEREVETVFRMIEQEDMSWLTDSSKEEALDVKVQEQELLKCLQNALQTASKEMQTIAECQKVAFEPVIREQAEILANILQ